MATEQEVFELVYKYVGEEQAKKLQDHLDLQKQKSAALQAQLDAMNAASQTTVAKVETEAEARKRMAQAIADEEKSRQRYIDTVAREAAIVEKATQKQAAAVAAAAAAQERAAIKAAEAAEKASARQAAAADKVVKKIGDGANVARQGFVDISRATQDFAQGGFSAIVNNLEGIGRGLPAVLKNPMALLTSLPSILTLVGVAFLTLGPKIGEFIAWLTPKPLIDFGTQIELLTKKIEGIKDKMKDGVKLAIDTRELDIAERKLKRLQEAQAKYDADQKQQNVAEAESGKQIAEAVKESPTGAPGVGVKIAEQFRKEKEQTSPELREATAEIERLTDSMKGASGPLQAQIQEKLDAAKIREVLARTHLATEAELAAGDLKKRVEEGHGRDQAAAQKEYAERLTRAGERPLANQVAGMTPQAARDKKTAIEAAENDKAADEQAAKVAREKAAAEKVIDDARKKLQEEGLAAITKSDDLDAESQDKAKAINKVGLGKLESFERLRDEIQQAILAKLRAMGVDVTKAEELTRKAAEVQADQAFAAVGREGQKEAKGGAAAEKKAEIAEGQARQKEAKATEDTLDAEVKRLTETFGKRLQDDYERITASNTTAIAAGAPVVNRERDIKDRQRAGQVAGQDFAVPPEVLQSLLRQQIATILRANKATEQGANLTAFGITGRGGIDLGRRQAATAPLMTRRARPLAKPKAGKTPMPKVVAKPVNPNAPVSPIVAKAREADEARKKAAAEAQAKFRPKAAPFTPARPEEIDLRPREVRERAAQVNAAQPGPQASIAPAVERTQDAVAATQQAVSQNTTLLAALNARCRVLESNARDLNSRAREENPSAGNTG